MCYNVDRIKKEENKMLEITDEIRDRAVYKNPDITIYPHRCISVDMPLLVYAVFKIVCHNLGDILIPLAISGNKLVAPLEEDWQKIFDDFMIFAKKNHMKSNDLAGAKKFFKNSNGDYSESSMKGSIDLWPVLKEFLEYNSRTKKEKAVRNQKNNIKCPKCLDYGWFYGFPTSEDSQEVQKATGEGEMAVIFCDCETGKKIKG